MGGIFGVLPFVDFCILILDKEETRYIDNKKVFMLSLFLIISFITHVLTLTQMYNALTSTLFKVTLFLNILLGVSALGLLVGDGIYLICAIFNYFEIILTELL